MPTELTPLLHYCLKATAVRLSDEFRGAFSAETIAHYVAASYEQVDLQRPTGGNS